MVKFVIMVRPIQTVFAAETLRKTFIIRKILLTLQFKTNGLIDKLHLFSEFSIGLFEE